MTSIIKVDEIQSKNGTSALTIDSSGRILQPAKPAFKMEMGVASGATNWGNHTDGHKFLPDTMRFNIGGHAEITATQGQFTCPVDGLYCMMYRLNFDSMAAAVYVNAYFMLNNSPINGSRDRSGRNIEDPQGGNYHTSNNTELFQFSAGDVISVNFFTHSDTSSNLRDGSVFQGYLVS
jgi:hypothetical protein